MPSSSFLCFIHIACSLSYVKTDATTPNMLGQQCWQLLRPSWQCRVGVPGENILQFFLYAILLVSSFTMLTFFLTVPSQPVGPEANYINSSALLVKWQPPLFPNGNITKYIVKYDLSDYSPWKEDLNWCYRQIFTSELGKTYEKDEEDNGKNLDCKNCNDMRKRLYGSS